MLVGGNQTVTFPSPIANAEHTDNINLFDNPQSNPQNSQTVTLGDAGEENTGNINLFDNPQSSETVDLFAAEDGASGGKPNIASAENTNITSLFDDPQSNQQSHEILNPSLIEHNMSVSQNTSTVVQEMIIDPHGSHWPVHFRWPLSGGTSKHFRGVF